MAQNYASAIYKGQRISLPEQDVFLHLIRTSDYLADGIRSLLGEYDISQPQYNVLRILRGAGKEGIQSQAIREHLVTRVPDVTRLLDRLEKAGYVRRQRCDNDRRVVWVYITADGLALLDRLDDPLTERHRELLSHLDNNELSQLRELLIRARREGNP